MSRDTGRRRRPARPACVGARPSPAVHRQRTFASTA